MYQTFRVTNFRCFDQLTLNDIQRVNLIAGVNNVGKTALLEALFIHCGAYNPELALRVNALRGMEPVKVELPLWAEAPWDSLFHGFRTAETIELSGEHTETGLRSLRLKLPRELPDLLELERYLYQTTTEPGQTQVVPAAREPVRALLLESAHGQELVRHYLVATLGAIRIVPPPAVPPFLPPSSGRELLSH